MLTYNHHIHDEEQMIIKAAFIWSNTIRMKLYHCKHTCVQNEMINLNNNKY